MHLTYSKPQTIIKQRIHLLISSYFFSENPFNINIFNKAKKYYETVLKMLCIFGNIHIQTIDINTHRQNSKSKCNVICGVCSHG